MKINEAVQTMIKGFYDGPVRYWVMTEVKGVPEFPSNVPLHEIDQYLKDVIALSQLIRDVSQIFYFRKKRGSSDCFIHVSWQSRLQRKTDEEIAQVQLEVLDVFLNAFTTNRSISMELREEVQKIREGQVYLSVNCPAARL